MEEKVARRSKTYNQLVENLPLIILVAVVLLFFRSLVFMRRIPLGSDLKVYYYPGWSFFHGALSSFSNPTWCDFVYSGFPLFADSEAGIFYPVNYLSYLLPLNVGYNLMFWLHYLLAAVFFYAYVREIGASRWPAVLMALPYSLSGFTLAHLVHPNLVITVAWLPLLLFCLERGMRRGRISWFVFAGGVMGIQFLAGFLMTALFGALLAPFYLFLYPRGGRTRKEAALLAVKGLALTLGVGFGLGMVQNLPSYYLVQESYRAGGLNENSADILRMTTPHALALFFPKLFGQGVDMGYWGAWYFEDMYGYVGMIPPFLAVFALRRRRQWHASFFFWALVASLAVSIGNAGLLWRFVHAMPGFDVLKAPVRFILLADLSLLVLGALGLERLIGDRRGDEKQARAGVWMLAAGAAWAAVWVAIALVVRYGTGWLESGPKKVAEHLFATLPGDAVGKYDHWTGFLSLSSLNFLLPLVLVVVVPLLLWFLARRKIGKSAAIAALLFLTVLEIFYWGAPMHKFTPVNQVETVPPAADVAGGDEGVYRSTVAKEAGAELGEDFIYAPNVPMEYSLEDPMGKSTVSPYKYTRLQETAGNLFSEKVLGLLNVRYLLAQPLRERGLAYDISDPVALCGARPRVTFPAAGCIFDQMCLLSHLQGGELLPEGTTVAWVTIRMEGYSSGPYAIRIGESTEQLEAEEPFRAGGRSSGGVAIYIYRHPGWTSRSWSYEGRVRFGAEFEAGSIEIELDPALYGRVFVLKAVSLHTVSGRVQPLEKGEVVYTGPRTAVYENPGESPRAYLVGQVVVEEDWELALTRAFDVTLDARETVVIEEDMLDPVLKELLNEWKPGRITRGSVEFVDPSGASKKLRIDAEEDGVLFISQNYLPGWRGWLDGKEIKLMRSYGCLTAVYIPAGEHRLEMRYTAPGIAAGATVTLSTIFLSLLLLLALMRDGRNKKSDQGLDGPGPTLPPLPPDPGMSVFFPAYNDEATIGDQVSKARKVLKELGADYEIIVIDDGSSDSTADVVREIMKQDDRVRLVQHEKNKGYGGALRTGFAAATRQLVFYTDGDGQYDVLELPLLYAKRDQADIVNGFKIKRNDPFYRIWLGSLYNMVASFLFRIRLVDIDCDFRLMRKEALDSLELESFGGTICLEMVKKLQDKGFTFAEQPVHHYARHTGRSSFFRPRHLYEMGKEFLCMWWHMMLKPRLRHG